MTDDASEKAIDDPIDDPIEAALNALEDEVFGEPADHDSESLPPIDINNPDIVGTAKRRYGKGAGALLAAGMFGLDKVLQEKKKTESVQVQEASSDPVDVDADGIVVEVDDTTTVRAPALERKAPITLNNKKKPRR